MHDGRFAGVRGTLGCQSRPTLGGQEELRRSASVAGCQRICNYVFQSGGFDVEQEIAICGWNRFEPVNGSVSADKP